MARQLTRWRPDTCGCVVDFSWDSESAEDGRVHVAEAIEPCELHPPSGDLQADFAAILAHNRANNAPEG